LFFVAEKLGMTAQQAGEMSLEELEEWIARFAMRGEKVIGA